MTGKECDMSKTLIMDVFGMIGGLSLFIFGMHVITGGLRAAAGPSLRTVIGRTSSGPLRGALLGIILGFLAHSGAATTMIAGFVNAGLLGLQAAVAPIMGANIGTALSMQLLSFNIGQYCWVAIAAGFLLKSLLPGERCKQAGLAMIGFGLLFLGMITISGSLVPHREALAPWLAHVRGDAWAGRLSGVGIAALLTAMMTSSGAMIGLCFVLISAGIFQSFDQFFPVIAGAHIGTCIVALLASLSMNIEARRAAAGHLFFNIFNVALALALYPFIRAAVVWSAQEPLRQAANLHLLMMATGALPLLPFTRACAWLLRRLVLPRSPMPEPSHLKPENLSRPEQAIRATILEVRRMARICIQGMTINGELMLDYRPATRRVLLANEAVIDDVKLAVGDYLDRLTSYALSYRQTLFIQHLDRCMKDIERIGDYQTALADTTALRWHRREAQVPEDIFRAWFDLFCAAQRVILLLERCLNPDDASFQEMASHLLEARDRFSALSARDKSAFALAARDRRITGTAAYYLHRYQADLDRMMGHVRSISVSLSQPEFWVRRSKLDRVEPSIRSGKQAARIDVKDYLARLYSDEVIEWKPDETLGEIESRQMPPPPPPEDTHVFATD